MLGAQADTGFSAGPAWGVLVLVLLGAVALVASRRRLGRSRRMEVLESLSLGPRRSLCLARVDGRVLVLGVSEAGVQLLEARAAEALPDLDVSVDEAPLSQAAMKPAQATMNREPAASPGRAGGWEEPASPVNSAFEQLLTESVAEQELRARLKAGRVFGSAT